MHERFLATNDVARTVRSTRARGSRFSGSHRLLQMLLCLTLSGMASAQDRSDPVLVVGSEQDFPPFAIGKNADTAGGFTVELWQAVAEQCGLEYQIRVRPFHQILHAFKNGEIDVLINFAQSDERRGFASFTVPHVTVHGAIFVRDGHSGIGSEDDLADKSIIVMEADLAHDYALSRGWHEQLVLVSTSEDGFRLLAAGEHDAMLLSKLAGMQTLEALDIRGIEALPAKVGFSQKFSFAVHKHDADLLARINEGLALTKTSGVYDAIYEKWFGVYERRDPVLRDVLKYLAPFLVVLLVLIGALLHQRRIERVLRLGEERFRAQMVSSPVAIFTTDRLGACEFTNQRWQQIYGRTFQESLGDGWCNSLHPLDRANVFAEWRRSVKSSSEFTMEFRVLRREEDVRHVRVLACPIFEGSQLRGFVGSVEDLTERRRAEIERAALERKAQQGQKLESLGVLAGGIAHDFNNLLTAVIGNISLALMEVAPTSLAAERMLDALGAAERSADLSRQMLAYSGKGRFVIKRVRLHDVVKEMKPMLQASISKRATLQFEFFDDTQMIEADVTQLTQIILNLVINASDAIGDHDGVITVATGVMACDPSYLAQTWLQEDLAAGLYSYLEVADTGCGIADEALPRIFDPFFTTKFTGRGLGLAAVLGIVRSHRGALEVSSTVGKGTTLRVVFPCVGASQKLAEAANNDADWRGRGCVLLVDDEEILRTTGKMMLERLGFTVLTAADGREAVDVFERRAEEIHAVLLDLTMPNMGGEKAFHELRRLRTDIRVILSSGYSESDVANRFAGQGLSGFISKPYDMAKLQAALQCVTVAS